ncbi:MAG: hypothetical protein IKG93_11285 [Clostridiales bacterium]|nr:hypothetical protein [Clostridiales bacterium]
MAKKKRPNNGNRPNSGKRPVNGERPNIGKRPVSGSGQSLNNERKAPIRDVRRDRQDMPMPRQEIAPVSRAFSDAKDIQVVERKEYPRRFDPKKRIEEQKIEEKKVEEKKEQVPPSYFNETADSDEVRRNHMAKKRKRDALKASLNACLCVVILIGVLCISVLYVVDYVAAKPKYAFATEGTIEHTIGAKALIIRDETVYKSTHTGSLLTQATEGSRVAVKQVLAMVIPEGMESVVTQLREVEKKIVDIERELMEKGKGEGAKAIFNEINAEISPIISTVRKDAILRNLSNMTSYSSSIRVLMEKRDSNIENIDFKDEQLNVLKSTQNTLKSQLMTQANKVEADRPGIVSYKLDGHENDLDLSQLMTMMDYKFTELIKKCNSVISSDLDIKADEPVLRIVQNDVQYLACTIEGATISDFQLESKHVIRIPSEGVTISDCKVIRASYAEDGLFVLFETNNQVERLLDRRTVNIEIVSKKKSTGIRVPVSSLVNPDFNLGFASIYVNESGYAREYAVIVIDYDREYAIISPVEGQSVPNLSTIVITNPSTVKVGDKVEK